MVSKFVLCKILQHGLTALGGKAPEGRRGRRRQGEVTLRHKDNKKRKYRVSPHLVGVSVFGGTELSP